MTAFAAESFYRATIRQSVVSTLVPPFQLKVTTIPKLTSGLLTISPNTPNEEIVEFNGVDAVSLAVTIVKRGIAHSAQSLTVNGNCGATGDYNNSEYMRSHSQNDSIRGDVNHLHLIQEYGSLQTQITNLGLDKIAKSIPDMRGSAIPNPQDYPKQTKVSHEFRPASGVEVGALGVTGTTNQWFVLETYSPWVSGILSDWEYVTQIAYGVGATTTEIYSRKATNATTWGSWLKVFPVDAAGLDFNALPTSSTIATNDFIPFREVGGINKKVSVDVLSKKVINSVQSKPYTEYSQGQIGAVGWVSPATYIPNGGLCTLSYVSQYGTDGTSLSNIIEYSPDGSSWSPFYTMNIRKIFGEVSDAQSVTLFIQPGYVRGRSTGHSMVATKTIITTQVF